MIDNFDEVTSPDDDNVTVVSVDETLAATTQVLAPPTPTEAMVEQ